MGRIACYNFQQFWTVCTIDAGLIGFVRAYCFQEASQIAISMLFLLDISGQPVFIYPIGPRLFTTEKIETGDA